MLVTTLSLIVWSGLQMTICTLDTSDAQNISEKIREVMTTDEIGNVLVRQGISVVITPRAFIHSVYLT